MPRAVPWCAAVALLLLPGSAAAQEPAGVLRELVDDVTIVESKIVALANAVPPEKYGWRPADGVRSTGEVFVHIAGEQPPVASKSGRHPTTRQLWIATVSHLHEHLGQLIAYARSNGVTPPWSK